MAPRPVVLVTGAGRRLGREIALTLGRAGWRVAVHYHRSADEAQAVVAQLSETGAEAHAFCADLADEAATRALLPAVVQHFGNVQAVVNNASLFEYDSISDFSYAAMDRHWRANTAPAIVLAQALHAHVHPRGGQGCVVNLLDQKLWNLNPDYFSYTLSKAALETATRMLAMALAPAVRVCGVAPGLVLGSEFIDPDKLAALHAGTLLGHGAQPADVAAAVQYLLQAAAVTGHTLLVDGGQHLQAAGRDFAFLPTPTKG